MQNLILTIFLFLLSTVVSAQEVPEKFNIEQGTWSLGGSFNFGAANINLYDDDYPDSKNFSLTIRPDVGYFVQDNLQLGLQLGYGYSENRHDDSSVNELKAHSLNFSPYVRKFFPLSSKFAFAITGSLDYGINQRDTYDEDIHVGQLRSEIYGISAQPDIFFLLNKRFTLNATMGNLYYSHSKYTRDGREIESGNKYGFAAQLNNIFLGVRYYIN